MYRQNDAMIEGNGPIRKVLPVDVRQSMANGGGPACLRLRVVADPAAVDPRFMLDEDKADLLERVISKHWPEKISSPEIGSEALAGQVADARTALCEALNLKELG